MTISDARKSALDGGDSPLTVEEGDYLDANFNKRATAASTNPTRLNEKALVEAVAQAIEDVEFLDPRKRRKLRAQTAIAVFRNFTGPTAAECLAMAERLEKRDPIIRRVADETSLSEAVALLRRLASGGRNG